MYKKKKEVVYDIKDSLVWQSLLSQSLVVVRCFLFFFLLPVP